MEHIFDLKAPVYPLSELSKKKEFLTANKNLIMILIENFYLYEDVSVKLYNASK